MIHPTAIIDPKSKLADDVSVGPYSVIGPNVTIGQGTTIGSGAIIEGYTTIGCNNRIFHHVTLGQEPQDLKYAGENVTLTIGDNNVIREHTTVHTGTANGAGTTIIGSDNFLMSNAHIGHDSIINNHCLIANNVLIGGHVIIEDYANVGGLVGVAPYVTIGRFVYLGGAAGVVNDCPPFMISDKHPARVRGVNVIGLSRNGFDQQAIKHLKQAWKCLFRRDKGALSEGLHEVTETFPDDRNVKELVEFMQRKSNSPNGRYAETLRKDSKWGTSKS